MTPAEKREALNRIKVTLARVAGTWPCGPVESFVIDAVVEMVEVVEAMIVDGPHCQIGDA